MYFIGFDIGGTKCAVSLGKVFDGVTELAEIGRASCRERVCQLV